MVINSGFRIVIKTIASIGKERIAEIKVIEKNCTKEEESLIKDDWEYEWCIYLEHIIGDFFSKNSVIHFIALF